MGKKKKTEKKAKLKTDKKLGIPRNLVKQPLLSIVTIVAESHKDKLQEYFKYLPKSVDIELVLMTTRKISDDDFGLTEYKTENEILTGETQFVYNKEFIDYQITIQNDVYLAKQILYEYSNEHGDFLPDFAQARNIAKSFATGKWIFSLDVDEILAPHRHFEFLEMIRRLDDNVMGVKIASASHFYDHIERVHDWINIAVVKLFRNLPEFQWKGKVHELIEWDMQPSQIMISEFIMEHSGYMIQDFEYEAKLIHRLKLMGNELHTLQDSKRMERTIKYLENGIKTYKSIKSKDKSQ